MRIVEAPYGQITFLFTNIVGATQIGKRISTNEWQRLITEHESRLHHCFQAYNGYVIENAGDGFLIAFVHAYNALCCAIDIQKKSRY